jgi:predicted outer membrane repeat protein
MKKQMNSPRRFHPFTISAAMTTFLPGKRVSNLFTLIQLFSVIILLQPFHSVNAQPLDPHEVDRNTAVLLHFDDEEGEIALDATENGFDMNLENGADWELPGWDNTPSAADLTAGAARINSNHIVGNNWDAITIEAFIFATVINNEHPIVYRMEWHNVADPSFYIALHSRGEVSAGVYANQPGSDNSGVVSEPGIIEAGQWYHVAMTWSSGQPTRIYVDGDLIATSNQVVEGTVRAGNDPLRIGCGWQGRYGWFYFQGFIDEVRISDIVRDVQGDGEAIIFTEPDNIVAEGSSEHVINIANEGDRRLRWRTVFEAEWMTCDPERGFVEIGGDTDLFVVIDAENLDFGIYEDVLHIASNDRNNPEIPIPIRLTISPRIINVPDDFESIQAAINDADNGNIIQVAPGNYVENINFSGKNILLRGNPDNPEQVTINGDANESVVSFCNRETEAAIMSGFTITNGNSQQGGGIFCDNSNPSLSNLIISENRANESGGGIYCQEAFPTCREVQITGNTAEELGGGIHLFGNSSIDLTNVTICGNTTEHSGGGIYVCDNSTAIIKNAIIRGNSQSEIALGRGERNFVTISYSDIEGGLNNIDFEDGDVEWSDGNIDDDPLFEDPDEGGFHLTEDSPCINTGDPLSPFDSDWSRADMGAFYFPHNLNLVETLVERWDDGEYDQDPPWQGLDNDGRWIAIVDNFGKDNPPCAEMAERNQNGTDWTALFTPMNCDGEFIINLNIHQRTPTFSTFKVGVSQGDYERENRGVEVRINFNNLDNLWYLCYWDHEGEAQSVNEIRIEYDSERWVNLVLSRDNDGGWIIIWDRDGAHEQTFRFQDSIEELSNPNLWWGGCGFGEIQGGSYIDDIVVLSNQIVNNPELQHFSEFVETDVNHSLLVLDVTFEGEQVPTGWEIGVYNQFNTLSGAGVWIEGERLGMASWGDDVHSENIIEGFNEGERFNFRIWDNDADIEYPALSEFAVGPLLWTPNANSALSLEAPADDVTVPLIAGWNMMSINVIPPVEFWSDHEIGNWENGEAGPEIFKMTDHLRIDEDNHRIEVMKNDIGQFYAPAFNFNNIPYWNLNEGYMMKMEEAIDAVWIGNRIPSDATIPLTEGWNISSYYPTYSLDASAEDFYVLSTILEHVRSAKDVRGRFMWPEFEFSNMEPWCESQGYLINVDRDIELNYPPQQDEVARNTPLFNKEFHHWESPTITDENMSILITSEFGANQKGYKIAAFNSNEVVVGIGTIDSDGRCGLAVYGDDITTDNIEGLKKGETFRLILWDKNLDTEVPLSTNAELKYESNGTINLATSAIYTIPNEFYLRQNFPNPFNDVTLIEFGLPDAFEINIGIYDVSGRLIDILTDGRKEAGHHIVTWNAGSVATGMYMLQMETPSFSAVRKVVLIK